MNNTNRYFAKVYGITALELFISVMTGILAIKLFPLQMLRIAMSDSAWLILGVIEIALVLLINHSIMKNKSTGMVAFSSILFSIVNGFTFVSIFMTFSVSAILGAFGTLAIIFLVMSLFGFFTKRDLSPMSRVLWFIVLGLFIVSLINIFFFNSVVYFITSVVGVIVFSIYIAVDTQMMKENAQIGTTNLVWSDALNLYLDLINLFIYLLNIFGSFSDNDN